MKKVTLFIIPALVLFLGVWKTNSTAQVPSQPGALIGDLPQAISLYTQLCANDRNGINGACSIEKIGAKNGWAYFTWAEDEAMGSGAARLIGNKWKVLAKGGGALMADGMIQEGCPSRIAKEIVNMLLKCEAPV